ncbi:hypothetical protein ACTFIV_005174 [Dictyostelium citrinum]
MFDWVVDHWNDHVLMILFPFFRVAPAPDSEASVVRTIACAPFNRAAERPLSLKPLFLILNITTHHSANVDVELFRYLADSAIIITVHPQTSLGRVRPKNISKEIYCSEVLQPIKIKDTPKMFDETETERSLLNLHSQLKLGGSNTNGNCSSNTLEQVLPNFKPVHNPILDGPKSACITKEVQDLLVEDSIEQLLPVPKPATNLLRPILTLKRLNTYIANQSFKMEGIKNLPSMVKQGTVLTTDASESGAGTTLKKGNKIIKTWSFQWSTTQTNMSSNNTVAQC